MIKAVIFALTICVSTAGVCADEQALILQPTEQLKRELFIQDWIAFNQFQKGLMSAGSYIADANINEKLVQMSKQNIIVHNKNIEMLKKLHVQTQAYQKVVALNIEMMELYNKRLEHIINENTGVTKPETVSSITASTARIKAMALERQYEVKILKYLKNTIALQSKNRLYSMPIEQNLLQEWVDYKLISHRLNTLPNLPLDINLILKDLNPSDAKTKNAIAEYQLLHPKNSMMQQLTQLRIRQLQQIVDMFTGINNPPKSMDEAVKNLKKLSEMADSQAYKQNMEMVEDANRLEKQINYLVFAALEKHYGRLKSES